MAESRLCFLPLIALLAITLFPMGWLGRQSPVVGDLIETLFPTNRALWRPAARRTRPATPASDGKFKLSGLPSGEYYMAAVIDYEYTDLFDASFLEQLAAGAFKITLGEGEKKVQDIRMGGS